MGESLVGRLAKRLISQVTDPIKIEVCRGCLFGCPKGIIEPKDLEMEILDLVDQLGLEEELKEHLPDESVFHPTLCISISGCVNGCSRPYIKDIGLEGIVSLRKNQEKCNNCGACSEVCQEKAIHLEKDGFIINSQKCLSCGECARVCPNGALIIEKSGINLMVGGKLGRHPQIGHPIANFLTKDQAVQKLRQILAFILQEHRQGHNVEDALKLLEGSNQITSIGISTQ